MLGSLGVIGAGTVWRVTGLDSAGRSLVRATASSDEQVRTLGGMMLVQAGERSVALVREASEEGQLNRTLVKALADVGGQKSESLLAEIAAAGGSLSEDASESLETLERIKSLGDDGSGI